MHFIRCFELKTVFLLYMEYCIDSECTVCSQNAHKMFYQRIYHNITLLCSDGTGRTGTYILIDMVLNRMAKGQHMMETCKACEDI